MKQDELIEGIDFYNELGFVVFTEHYHIKRGFCCGNGCRNCPYKYINVAEPKKSTLLQNKTGIKKKN